MPFIQLSGFTLNLAVVNKIYNRDLSDLGEVHFSEGSKSKGKLSEWSKVRRVTCLKGQMFEGSKAKK